MLLEAARSELGSSEWHRSASASAERGSCLETRRRRSESSKCRRATEWHRVVVIGTPVVHRGHRCALRCELLRQPLRFAFAARRSLRRCHHSDLLLIPDARISERDHLSRCVQNRLRFWRHVHRRDRCGRGHILRRPRVVHHRQAGLVLDGSIREAARVVETTITVILMAGARRRLRRHALRHDRCTHKHKWRHSRTTLSTATHTIRSLVGSCACIMLIVSTDAVLRVRAWVARRAQCRPASSRIRPRAPCRPAL